MLPNVYVPTLYYCSLAIGKGHLKSKRELSITKGV